MSFSDKHAVAGYAARPPKQVPGFAGMQRMARLLIAERAPQDAEILVVGAGGGLELKVFAEAEPGWRFTGVDPSAEMLDLAGDVLGPLAARVGFHHGYIDTAPDRPFHAATALLTLHFLDRETRLHTLREIHRRLVPGAPLVVVHHSVPEDPDRRLAWLQRSIAFAIDAGVAIEDARSAARAMAERLPALSPEDDEAMLTEAGFADVELFYAGFSFRGWVAYA